MHSRDCEVLVQDAIVETIIAGLRADPIVSASCVWKIAILREHAATCRRPPGRTRSISRRSLARTLTHPGMTG